MKTLIEKRSGSPDLVVKEAMITKSTENKEEEAPNEVEQSTGSESGRPQSAQRTISLASHSKKLLTLSGRQRGDIEVLEVR